MNLTDTYTLARQAMDAYGLTDWRLEWDNHKTRNGATYYMQKRIVLSAHTTHHRTRAEVLQTIGHEIAHALCPIGSGHGPVWQAKMRELGLKVERCSVNSEESMERLALAAKYTLRCAVSGKIVGKRSRTGKRKFACLCHGVEVQWRQNY